MDPIDRERLKEVLQFIRSHAPRAVLASLEAELAVIEQYIVNAQTRRDHHALPQRHGGNVYSDAGLSDGIPEQRNHYHARAGHALHEEVLTVVMHEFDVGRRSH